MRKYSRIPYSKNGTNVKCCCRKTSRHTNIQAHGFRVPLNDCQIVTDVTFCLAYASRWVYRTTEFQLEITWWNFQCYKSVDIHFRWEWFSSSIQNMSKVYRSENSKISESKKQSKFWKICEIKSKRFEVLRLGCFKIRFASWR